PPSRDRKPQLTEREWSPDLLF
ncbi:MAG: hypothetical protein QOI53_2772, partial [Verrucomicrobiota bacterium]|nr:hypothetical protein [Verrucomicrobiota bacterium]